MLRARRLQRTIAGEAVVRGVGFIEGRDVALRFLPAGADEGVVFVRVDLPGRPRVRARAANVIPRGRRTTIQRGEAVVEMVEHVMAALSGLGIDNCLVEIDGPETPGCDGSSLAFVESLAPRGTVELDRLREVHLINVEHTHVDGLATLTARPSDEPGMVLSYHLDYGPDSPIVRQDFTLGIDSGSFCRELASSRTFLLEAEALALRAAGIGSRSTESDLLIFGPSGVIGNTLRFPDECARHKMLDMVGDLALLEKDIVGRVDATRSGHQHNVALVRALLAADARRSAGPEAAPSAA